MRVNRRALITIVSTASICIIILTLVLILPRRIERVASAETVPDGDQNHFILLNQVPHDSNSFTQGLTWDGQRLFESSGLYAKSNIREIHPTTGEVLRQQNYPSGDFAEGITLFENSQGQKQIIGITWKERNGYIFDPDTLQQIKTFQYNTFTSEGWGITYNNCTREFIVTDGSHYLHFWDRDTLQEIRRIPVMNPIPSTQRDGGGGAAPLLLEVEDNLNELELIEGGKYILANVWQTDYIVKINTQSGIVEAKYDMSTLYPDREIGSDVLNGISATNVVDEYWVTGKLWPIMFRIKLLG